MPSPDHDPVTAVALLDEPNRRRLYEYVAASHGEIGRDEAAAAVGISRALAAFHLDRLMEGGLLQASYRRPAGRGGPGAGRPAKRYRRTDDEITVSLPARRYGVVAEVLAEGLERLAEDEGMVRVADAVGAVAKARGREVGREALREAGPRPGRARLRDALVDLLAEAGYEPEVSEADGDVRLCNCPYRMLSDEHRDLTCGMNLAWAEGVVDGLGDAQIEPRAAPLPGRCCVSFTPNEA